MKPIEKLFRFIQKSPTAFHAVEAASELLEANGFMRLEESQPWALACGKKYYLTRNQSSIVAFCIPEAEPVNFLISASHTDSPMFKLKPGGLSPSGTYARLATEVYGGTILSSWFDRPLSLAGRVILNRDGAFTSHPVNIDRDLLIIPNLAIHFNRTINTGYSYNPAVDTLPMLSLDRDADVNSLLCRELECKEDEIVGSELYVYNRMAPTVLGANEELFASPRIDNLMCMWGTLEGFLHATPTSSVNVFFAADNEETGSSTKQGAGSVLLSDVINRICESIGKDRRMMLAASMMVSADNAHAKHPNHPEVSDPLNAPVMGGGVVIKSNAAQRYTTDALSASLFGEICRSAGVGVQAFANRADLPGGSTLGSISNTLVPLLTVDIGMAQLAMHSAYETAAVSDAEALERAMQCFYSSNLRVTGDGNAVLACDSNRFDR